MRVSTGNGPRMVSQNFRRHGNMNKKMTRENRGRGGNKVSSFRGGGRGGRGRGSKRAGWRGFTQTYSFDLGAGSSFGEGKGPTSEKFNTGFQADPYGVLNAGRLAALCDLDDDDNGEEEEEEEETCRGGEDKQDKEGDKDVGGQKEAKGGEETTHVTVLTIVDYGVSEHSTLQQGDRYTYPPCCHFSPTSVSVSNETTGSSATYTGGGTIHRQRHQVLAVGELSRIHRARQLRKLLARHHFHRPSDALEPRRRIYVGRKPGAWVVVDDGQSVQYLLRPMRSAFSHAKCALIEIWVKYHTNGSV